MDLPKEFLRNRTYKLKELADLWNKTEDELLVFIETCMLVALSWYDGDGFKVGEKPYVNDVELYSSCNVAWRGWTFFYGSDASQLRVRGSALKDYLHGYQGMPLPGEEKKTGPQFIPAERVEIEGQFFWKTKKHRVTVDELAISYDEFVRFEESFPDVIQRKGNANNEIEKPLPPTAKYSLLKMIIAMAIDGYGYDPDELKSKTPAEIAAAVSSNDHSIDVDTVRKWLKEAAKLPKDPI